MFLFFFLVEQSFNYCLGQKVKEKKKQVGNTNIKNYGFICLNWLTCSNYTTKRSFCWAVIHWLSTSCQLGDLFVKFSHRSDQDGQSFEHSWAITINTDKNTELQHKHIKVPTENWQTLSNDWHIDQTDPLFEGLLI